jgi:hypothetical protein
MERVKDLNMDEEQMMKDIQKGRYDLVIDTKFVYLRNRGNIGNAIF